MQNINTKIYNYSDIERICVFDNVYSIAEQNYFYEFVLKSRFMFARGAFNFPEAGSNVFQLHSIYSDDDLKAFKIFKNKNLEAILKDLNIDSCKVDYSKVNACLSSDVYQYHVDSIDSNCWSLLYFANIEWLPEWEGETIFSEQDRKNIFQSVAFVPGRIVLFNGSIPHKSSQPAHCAPYQRFVFNARFNPAESFQGKLLSEFITA